MKTAVWSQALKRTANVIDELQCFFSLPFSLSHRNSDALSFSYFFLFFSFLAAWRLWLLFLFCLTTKTKLFSSIAYLDQVSFSVRMLSCLHVFVCDCAWVCVCRANRNKLKISTFLSLLKTLETRRVVYSDFSKFPFTSR